jgi:selenocysteine-specific elongation factor
MIKELLLSFSQSPFTPPGVKECQEMLGKDVYQALNEQEILIEVSSEIVFRHQDYQLMLEKIMGESEITVAQFRDLFQTSRKYALAFLEHLDAIGLTTRDGDVHKMKRSKR